MHEVILKLVLSILLACSAACSSRARESGAAGLAAAGAPETREVAPTAVDAGRAVSVPSAPIMDAGVTVAPSSVVTPPADAGAAPPAEPAAMSGARLPQTWPVKEWSMKTPEDLGMDGALLERARAYAFEDSRHTQSIVVVRAGVIVAEWYAMGRNADSWVTSWSVAKSFAGALVGLAIDDGLIESVDVSMAKFLPSWAGTEKEKIRLRDVLQQASGLDWNEHYDPSSALDSDVVQITFQGGAELSFASDKALIHAPGSVFNYSSGNSMLLSAVIQVATGMSAADYARKKLFEPLGMSKVEWWQSTDGHTLTFCCIDTTARDFARFGLLYARGGMWAGKRLMPASWISESLSPSASRSGYGYQWWLLGKLDQEGPPDSTPPETSKLPPDTFAAIGVDEQLIYVVPQYDLVVVRNGTYQKEAAAAVADNGLFWHIPPQGIDPSRGTETPSSWRNDDFLQLVFAAVKR